MSASATRFLASAVSFWMVLIVVVLGIPRLLISLEIDNSNTYFAVLWSTFILLTAAAVIATARRNHGMSGWKLLWITVAVVPLAFAAWAGTTYLWQLAFGEESVMLIGRLGYLHVLALGLLCAAEAAAMTEYFSARLTRSQLLRHAPN